MRTRATIVAVKKKSITYSEWVLVALVIPHSMRMRLPRCSIFFHIIITNGTILENVRFDFLYKFVWHISHSKEKWVKYDYKCILVFMYSTDILVGF
jgi:hypothetical protein